MELTESGIRQLFPAQDFLRGKKYYQENRVGSLQVVNEGETTSIQSTVRGSRFYNVKLVLRENNIMCRCDCPRFEELQCCKHIAATLLAYIKEAPQLRIGKTDLTASRILTEYLSRAETAQQPAEPVRLNLSIKLNRYGYPEFRFFVGRERMYVIQDLEKFADNVYSGRTVSYGKNLSFQHDIKNFDQRSQAFIRLLLNEFPRYRTKEYKGYGSSYDPMGYNKRYIQFEGDSFERMFELLRGQSVDLEDSNARISFRDADPQVTVRLNGLDGGASLEVDKGKDYYYFGNSFRIYAVSANEILRCSSEFAERVYPLITMREQQLRFAERDIPTLCDYVISQLEGLVSVDDEGQIIERNMPDDCSARYYFDMSPILGLTGEIRYLYGDQCIRDNDGNEKYTGIRQNQKRERELRRPLEQSFDYSEENGLFYLQDEDAAIELLVDGMEVFHNNGEVYISETLQRKRINTSKAAAVGISVSGGMLTLNLNSGEFPPEELEALYQSLLKRKRYHRLPDGRYLPLDGSGYEKLAEIAHMTQLDAKELSVGSVTMPAFRALYLDRVLGKNEGIQVERNDGFRRLVRDFKTLEDSDFQPPKELEQILRSYQKTGYKWMKTLETNGFGGILADEMGLGKTLQVLALLLTATRSEKAMPSLVVCPSSLILNWADEISRFAPSLSFITIDRIRERLVQSGISSFTIEGATPKEKRAQLVKEFNAGGASVFLISLKAGGTGLNLTGADVVIHYDPWWNLAAQNQATDRSHRIGQMRNVNVYKLIAENTIEEKILRLQEKKAALMDSVTVETGAAPLSREEILELLS